MQLRLESVDLFANECATRLPFRFGAHTLTAATMLTARARIAPESGGAVEGFAADLAMPKWFEKDASKTPAEDVRALTRSAQAAAAAALEHGAAPRSVFDLWRAVYAERVESVPFDAPDRLVRGFGVALVERALIDASCRAQGRPFFRALKEERLGFDAARVDPALSGMELGAALPDEPLARLRVRHTVGLLDALRDEELGDARPADGRPASLAAAVRAFGLEHFKLKLCGQREADRERLLRVAEVLDESVPGSWRYSLDANEQYGDLGELVALLESLAGTALPERLMYLEQPLPRARSFDPELTADLARLERYAPTILDEADCGLEAFPRATALGYRGVSVKCCKGVFRALANHLRVRALGNGAFLSGEDLTNLPVLPLQQDLALAAALHLPSVERNGHQYFSGLAHLPAREARAALAAHPDLYEATPTGTFLAIRDGRLELGSLQPPGFGHALDIAVGERQRLAPGS